MGEQAWLLWDVSLIYFIPPLLISDNSKGIFSANIFLYYVCVYVCDFPEDKCKSLKYLKLLTKNNAQ